MKNWIFGATLVVCSSFSNSAYANNSAQCFKLWTERNLIFDRNGYCFSSTLGKSYFGTSRCRTKSPSLTSGERQQVASIKARERSLGCRVNTSKRYHWSENQSTPSTSQQPVKQARVYKCKATCLDTRRSFGQQNVNISFSVRANSSVDLAQKAYSAHASICSKNGWDKRFADPSCY